MQSIVALSTAVIIQIGRHLSSNYPIQHLLIVFVLLLVVVYIPAIASKLFLEKAKIHAFIRYITTLKQNIYGQIQLFTSPQEKNALYPWLAGEAQTTIQEALDHFYNYISTFCNIFFNVLVIIIAFHPIFLITYLISFILVAIMIVQYHSKIAQSTHQFVDAKNCFRNTVTKLFENTVLGNIMHHNTWLKQFTKHAQTLTHSVIHLEVQTQLLSAFTMIICLLPIMSCFFLVTELSSILRLHCS